MPWGGICFMGALREVASLAGAHLRELDEATVQALLDPFLLRFGRLPDPTSARAGAERR